MNKQHRLVFAVETSLQALINKANQCKESPNFIEDDYMVGYYSATTNAITTISDALKNNGIDLGIIKVTKIIRL